MKLNLFTIVALLFSISLVKVNGYVNCNNLSDPVEKCICQVRQYTSVKLENCQSNNTTIKKKNDEILRNTKIAVEEVCKKQVKSKDRNGRDCIKAFDLKQTWCSSSHTCCKSCTDAIADYLDAHYSKFEEQSFFIGANENYPIKYTLTYTNNLYYVDHFRTVTLETCNNWRKQSF